MGNSDAQPKLFTMGRSKQTLSFKKIEATNLLKEIFIYFSSFSSVPLGINKPEILHFHNEEGGDSFAVLHLGRNVPEECDNLSKSRLLQMDHKRDLVGYFMLAREAGSKFERRIFSMV